MIRIVADDKIPFLKGALEGVAEIRYLPGAQINRSDLMGADALITRTRTTCNQELLEGTPVRFIATATIGYDHIDSAYCAEKGIRWTNAPGCNSSSRCARTMRSKGAGRRVMPPDSVARAGPGVP